MEPDEWYTRQEVCDYLKLSMSTIQRRMEDKTLEVFRIGRLVRISGRSARAMLERQQDEDAWIDEALAQ